MTESASALARHPVDSPGICGLGGLAYGAIVVHCARRQTDYEPVWEDWLWYAVLPCVSYAALTVTAAVLRTHPHLALFVIGAAALGLLLIGMPNSARPASTSLGNRAE